jgi:hypothetical protein
MKILWQNSNYLDDVKVKFKCHSILEAENIIDMILEPNDLEVGRVNLLK